MGITAKILKEASIEVISEKDLGGNINGYIWFLKEKKKKMMR